jgi:hypothetical protein
MNPKKEGYSRLKKLEVEQEIIYRVAQHHLVHITQQYPELQRYAFFEQFVNRLEGLCGKPIVLERSHYEKGKIIIDKLDIPDPYKISRRDISSISVYDAEEMVKDTSNYIFDMLNEQRPQLDEVQRKQWFRKFKRDSLEKQVEFTD